MENEPTHSASVADVSLISPWEGVPVLRITAFRRSKVRLNQSGYPSRAWYPWSFLLRDSADSEYDITDPPRIVTPVRLLPTRSPTTAFPGIVAFPAVSISVVTDPNAAIFAHISLEA